MDSILQRAKHMIRRKERDKKRLREEFTRVSEEIKELQSFIAVYQQLAPESAESASDAEEHVEATALLRSSEISLAEAVNIVLHNASKAMGPMEVAERMVAAGYPYEGGVDRLARSLRGTLSRMSGNGEVVRLGYGEYGLREWLSDEQIDALNEEEEETPEPVAADSGAEAE